VTPAEVAIAVEPHLRRIAERHNPPPPLDADDLVQEALLAICRLSFREDMDRRQRFSYALTRGSGAMIDSIRLHQWGGHRDPRPAPISVNVPVAESAGEVVTLGDMLEAPSDDVSQPFADELLASLADEGDRLAVTMAVDGRTRREIGDALGMSESGASLRMIRLRRRLEAAGVASEAA
jgi:RNA polymerase sigma factor (sigma-70 family)